jgi:hypothetical protein
VGCATLSIEPIMAPWIEYDQPTPFDLFSIEGRRDLDGDLTALKYRQKWVEGRRYPIIHFLSEVEREITTGRGDVDEPHIHIFGNLELPYQRTRDETYQHVIPFAQDRGLILSKEHDQKLRIANPHTRRSYLLTFDNDARHLSNVELFPEYAMELMPGEIRAVLPPIRSQESKGLDAIAPVKYFTPDSSWTWYATEFDGDDYLFGLVSGYEVEYGYFTLSELEEVRGGLNLPIERDLYYEPKPLRELEEYERKLKR